MDDLCKECHAKIDQMVDANRTRFLDEAEVSRSSNPFFESASRATGKVHSDKDNFSSKIKDDISANDSFWLVVLTLGFVLIAMIIYFID